MKRLFLTLILLVLLIGVNVYPCLADVDTLEGQATENLGDVEGQAIENLSKIDGQDLPPATSCPPWYAESLWAWDGDHDSGHNFACLTNGTAVEVENDSATTHTDYGDGSVGILIDDISTFLRWAQTASDDPVDPNVGQTMCLKVFVPTGGITGNTGVFEARSSEITDNLLVRIWSANGWVVGDYNVATGTDQSVTAATLGENAFKIIAYSWETPSGPGGHGVDPGDGAGYDDADELTDAMTNGLDFIILGNETTVDPVEAFWIDDAALVSGYQFDCSTLTGW